MQLEAHESCQYDYVAVNYKTQRPLGCQIFSDHSFDKKHVQNVNSNISESDGSCIFFIIDLYF